jgi:hypothetical protein
MSQHTPPLVMLSVVTTHQLLQCVHKSYCVLYTTEVSQKDNKVQSETHEKITKCDLEHCDQTVRGAALFVIAR